MAAGRFYLYNCEDGEVVPDREFRAYFRDEKARSFYRIVRGRSPVHAVAQAMADDRRLGGGPITFEKLESH